MNTFKRHSEEFKYIHIPSNNFIINTIKSKIFNVNISPLFEQLLSEVGETTKIESILNNKLYKKFNQTYKKYLNDQAKINKFGSRCNYSAFKIDCLVKILNEKRLPTLIEFCICLKYDEKV